MQDLSDPAPARQPARDDAQPPVSARRSRLPLGASALGRDPDVLRPGADAPTRKKPNCSRAWPATSPMRPTSSKRANAWNISRTTIPSPACPIARNSASACRGCCAHRGHSPSRSSTCRASDASTNRAALPMAMRLLKEVGQALARIDASGLVAHPESDKFARGLARRSRRPAGRRRRDWTRSCTNSANARSSSMVNRCTWRMSAGLALSPLHGEDGESLERSALAALAEAKKRRARVLPFTEDLRGRAARRLELERDLRNAIDSQPVHAASTSRNSTTATQRLLGAEALLRWRRPDGSILGRRRNSSRCSRKPG